MVDARLPASLEAASFVRRAESEGGNGVVIARGDPDRGVLILLIAERGQHVACLERAPDQDGLYRWQKAGPTRDSSPADLQDWTAKRRKFDRDLWLIELDVPHPERFIAETIAIS